MKLVDNARPAEAARPRQIRLAGRLARAFGIVTVAILVMMALVMWLLGAIEGLDQMRALLGSAKPYLVLLHFGAIGLLWWFWEALIRWADRLSPVPESFLEAMLALRHRAALFLVAIELIVVVGLPALIGGPAR